MDLAFTEEERKFRDDVRQLFRDNIPSETQRKLREGQHLSKDEIAVGTRVLHRMGVPSWPKEYGGAGWSPIYQYIYEEERQALPATRLAFGYGVDLVGPVIYTFGNEAQKLHFLPRIINAEDWWCQGFSEPGAGSDLASLRTRAVRNGDHYVVNGQKIWTTWAHHADWIFCLVRTNPDVKKQDGISFLLIDMKTPGVVVRPIKLIDGGHEVNEVFFSDVRVPIENLVGEENKGWTYAKFLLGNERFADAGLGIIRERVQRAKNLASQCLVGGKRLIEEPAFLQKVAAVEVEMKAFEITQLRAVTSSSTQQAGSQDPASSILKLRGSEIEQAAALLLLDLVGPYALPDLSERQSELEEEPATGSEWAKTAAPTYFYSRAATIYSGSSEIQKNIIAKAILGL
ncbi:pimeloyl-CoA dehydrogenase large subunit [Mesorhizobium erdmanii]|uniref:Pimeloyl-CoA dehydrogenase large subunit n=2 Tax=Mesorhizobium TaxID=68287 RepID=A0A3M9X454_9HYPH|nr:MULTISPECIES: acyl-CoA dehydrogenase family protein [Mesorhizobium]RNJ42799.1 pimeloyl-CoA dehydrogenase large subunit [Mesorhizobium japonicum]RXT42665.1 pimeloyl-CoA dehydrogenase large subunit [Mesorhizobium erdmanii]